MIIKNEFQVSQYEVERASNFLQSSKNFGNTNIEDKLPKHATNPNPSDFAIACVIKCIEVYKARHNHRAIITLLNTTYHLNIMLGSDLLLLNNGQAVTPLL